MNRQTYALGPVAALLLAACGSGAAPGGGPAVEEVRRVTLQESKDVYVARPGGLALDDGGHLLLTDFFQKSIFEFDAAGRFVARYGAAGSGPGEFAAIGGTVLAFDSLVGAQDYRSRMFHFYDRRSRQYVGSRRVKGVATTGTMVGRSVWLTNIDPQAGLGMSLWALSAEPIDERSAELPPLQADRVPLPAEYLKAEPLRGTYPLAYVAAWRDSALVGWAAGPQLLVLAGDGSVRDSLFVPAVRRRGIPADLAGDLAGRRFDAAKLFRSVSGLYGLSRTPDGHFVAVHIDPELHRGNRITGRLFVTLVSPDRQRACVDREIPASDVSQPLVALRGDSIFVTEQHLQGEPGSVTTVKTYRVSAAGCEWISTKSPEA